MCSIIYIYIYILKQTYLKYINHIYILEYIYTHVVVEYVSYVINANIIFWNMI